VKLVATPAAMRSQLLRFTRQNAIALAPFLVFAGVEADDLLALLYPPLPPAAATAARILCVVGGLRTLGFVLPPLLAALGRASRVLAYEAVAAVVLPAGFVIAATVAHDAGFVAVAWAWAAGDPLAFAVLLAMALPAAQLTASLYVRALLRIVACAAAATLAAELVRAALPASPLRVVAVAAAVLAVYLGLLAKLERITPATVIRWFRGSDDEA
jgi:O-antigen/teichoic acid export membrane protein